MATTTRVTVRNETDFEGDPMKTLVFLMTAFLTTLAFSMTLTAPAEAQDEPVCEHPPESIILVRHACKTAAANSADPSLCKSGWKQAEELVERLKDYPIDEILVTVKRRSEATALELAYDRGLVPVEPHMPDRDDVLADKIREICSDPDSEGKSFLYVGHSFTLGGAFEALGLKLGLPGFAGAWIVTFPDGKPVAEYNESQISCGAGCAS